MRSLSSGWIFIWMLVLLIFGGDPCCEFHFELNYFGGSTAFLWMSLGLGGDFRIFWSRVRLTVGRSIFMLLVYSDLHDCIDFQSSAAFDIFKAILNYWFCRNWIEISGDLLFFLFLLLNKKYNLNSDLIFKFIHIFLLKIFNLINFLIYIYLII